MSWVAVGVVGAGGLLGAAGSIAGPLLADKPEAPDLIPGLGFDPSADPLLAANQVDLLASQGLFLPGQFEQAGPLEQAVQNLFSSSVVDPDVRVYLPVVARQARDAIARFRETGDPSELSPESAGQFANFLATQAGFDTLADLANAQTEFEQEIARSEDRIRQQAELSRERRQKVQEALTGLVDDFADFGDVRAREEERLRTNALERASLGGFNPESVLRDADLQALTNAIGIIGGQGQVANTIASLDPANRAQGLGPGVVGMGFPNQLSGITALTTPPDNRTAQAVSGGLGAIGNTTTSLGLGSALGLFGGSSGPATGGSGLSRDQVLANLRQQQSQGLLP